MTQWDPAGYDLRPERVLVTARTRLQRMFFPLLETTLLCGVMAFVSGLLARGVVSVPPVAITILTIAWLLALLFFFLRPLRIWRRRHVIVTNQRIIIYEGNAVIEEVPFGHILDIHRQRGTVYIDIYRGGAVVVHDISRSRAIVRSVSRHLR